MKTFEYDINGYTLHTIKTDRFKTIGLRISIRIKNKKEYSKYIPMLWRMLISTSSKYDTLKEINEACAKIYDPSYTIRIVNSGSEIVLSLSASFVNEKYTEKGMNEENIKFLSEFLFKPKIIDGGFDPEIFDIKKEKLIEYYSSLKNHPRDYADYRIEEEMIMSNYKNYSLDEIIKITESLTNKELYDFYNKIMKEGKLDIFVCGNFLPSKIKNIFKKNIRFLGKRKGIIKHVIEQEQYNKVPNIVIEDSSNVQSNLIIGCKAVNINEFERKYVFVLYSWILGGGMNSLLNSVVREENSLCYYIYAMRKALLGCMKIYAGIDAKDFEKTYTLIKRQMRNMEKGNFSDELFEGVKNIYYNSLISIDDYQEEMMDSVISEVFTGTDNIDDRRRNMKKVTKQDVMEFAKKIHIDTVYLLKGDKHEKNNI